MIRVERFDEVINPPAGLCSGRIVCAGIIEAASYHLCARRKGHAGRHYCPPNLAHIGTYVWLDTDEEARKL